MVLGLLIVGFGCGTDGADEGTLDVRVDHASDKVESTLPHSCVNEDGKAFVVWVDGRDKSEQIWFNMSNDGGESFLGTDTKLSKGKVEAANPSIACAGDNVYVAWEDKRDGELGYQNIYVQWSNDGGRSWQKDDLMLDADPDGDYVSISPAVAAAGDSAWVVWADQVHGAYDIFLSRTGTKGDSWSKEPVRIDTDADGSAFSANPVIAGDKDGNVLVAWEDRRDGDSDIYANGSSDGGKTFSASDSRVDGGDDPGASNSFQPRIAMAGGHGYAVWQDERFGENADILFNSVDASGNNWSSEALRVESDAEGIADSRNPAVAAQGETVVVAFQDNRSGGYDIFTRWSTDAGVSWATDEEARMDTDDNGQAQSYNPVISLSGDVWAVAWQDYRDDVGGVGFNDLFYNYSPSAGEVWQTSDVRINSIAPASSYAVDQSFYVIGDRVLTVWADGRFGTSDIFAAGRAVGEQSVYKEPEADPAAK